ncbi:uncharacterized protein BcabD6B2_53640 [Babesia caballi]|uniref:Uncharacterized protein n=1 Tax=Babesia caballi TaxID=5871 RepID=A0AAV4M1N1_BABCB|nr:hypothetical protein BcabD6B2_53640 [Babesia caballi]
MSLLVTTTVGENNATMSRQKGAHKSAKAAKVEAVGATGQGGESRVAGEGGCGGVGGVDVVERSEVRGEEAALDTND